MAVYSHNKARYNDEATYERIEDLQDHQYGTFNRNNSHYRQHSLAAGASAPMTSRQDQLYKSNDTAQSSEGGYLDGGNGIWRCDTLALRDKPVILSDKTKTTVRHVWGNYTIAVVILFAITFPFGICLLFLLPFLWTKKTRWMKNAEHVDPISSNMIGVYRRGKRDAPRTISFHRLANTEDLEELDLDEDSFSSSNQRSRPSHSRRNGERSSHSRSSSGSSRHRSSRVRFSNNMVTTDPIKLFITFKNDPVELPDGETTITRKRIGACNLTCAYVTYFLGCILFPIPLLCFMMPCLKDTEHVHPRTKEIVGVHYKDVGLL